MNKFQRTRMIFAPTLAVACTILVAATRPEPPTERDLGAAWVAANIEALPTTFVEITAKPYAYRKLILRELTLEQEKAAWRGQLSAFLLPPAKRSWTQTRMVRYLGKELSAPQRSMVEALSDSLDHLFDATLTSAERLDVTKTLCELASTVFNDRDKSLVFAHFGPVEPAELAREKSAVSQAALFNPVAIVRSFLRPAAPAKLSACSCAAASCDCTGIGMYCSQTFPACGDTESGCGCFNNYPCDGVCQ